MDQGTRKKYYNRCNPYEPLEPEDDRNLDLDSLTAAEGVRVRGINWVDKLVDEISLSDKPVCKLFTGYRGAGKTTELKRLVKELAAQDHCNMFPVLIDGEQFIDIYNPIEVCDIIITVVSETEREVARARGKDPENALEDGYLKRFWNWLTKTDVQLKQGGLPIPLVGQLPIEMKANLTFREKIRKAVAAHFTQFIDDARKEMKRLDNEVRKHLKRDGMVVILDSLEKLRGSDNILESAEHAFRDGAPYLRLPVHILYTVPMVLRNRIPRVDFLPMIKIKNKDETPYEPGIDAARQIIRLRVPDDILKEFLGEDCEKRTRELIFNSGGYIREIVEMLQYVIREKNHPLSDREFRYVLTSVADQYRPLVSADMFHWLALVARDKYLTIQNDGHRLAADRMLSVHAVLGYLNDNVWFDLHPAVKEIPGVKEELEQQ